MDDGRARELLAAARVARLATVGADGRPHLVPIVFALDGDTLYQAVDHKPKRTTALRRLANAEATGVASVLADHYDEEWSRLWWVRADGTARVLAAGTPEAAHAVALLVAKYPRQYADTPPAGPVLAVTITRLSGWSG